MTSFSPQQLAARKAKGSSNAKPNSAKIANPAPGQTTPPAPDVEPEKQEEKPPGDTPPGAEPPADQNKDLDLPDADEIVDGTDHADIPSSVMFDIPIGEMQTGFCTPRIDFKATPRQAAAAKMLWCTLSKRGERFSGGISSNSDGTIVENVNGGIRWLLDQVADAIEAETGLDLVNDYDQIFR